MTEHSTIFGARERGGFAYRRISLTGDIVGTLEYAGRTLGYEAVLLDGKEIGRISGNGPAFPTPIEFTIPLASGDLPARIDIKTRFVLFIGAFRLLIEDRVVYSEGRW